MDLMVVIGGLWCGGRMTVVFGGGRPSWENLRQRAEGGSQSIRRQGGLLACLDLSL